MSFLQIVGDIAPPEQLSNGWGSDVTGNATGSAGLIGLINAIVKFIITVGGIWSFLNLVIAGLTFITAGDNPDNIKKANDRMTMSGIGLVIMIGAVVITGVLSYLFYHDASAILNPQIYGPGGS